MIRKLNAKHEFKMGGRNEERKKTKSGLGAESVRRRSAKTLVGLLNFLENRDSAKNEFLSATRTNVQKEMTAAV
jgi:hypothetical protein